ncbi:MAG: cell division ATP-binding protein FtsE [Candidatus Margulisbacteria bacterium]|nr:cell division ATP-binding protein FtsE [Candidatus Margulisiibacteriota bacterium]
MIKFVKLSKVYSNHFTALKDINLTISQNEFVYLVGQSGAGKSTLLSMVYRACKPSSGDIFIENYSLKNMPDSEIPFLRRNIGVIFQDYKLLPKRTVYENIAFALRVMHFSRSRIHRQVGQVLELVGLEHKFNCMPWELSGGEKQRICIARAIVNNPAILLADEPTGNLDPDTSWEIMMLLTKINTRNTTVVVATHNDKIVDALPKRVVAIEKGAIVRDQQLGRYDT